MHAGKLGRPLKAHELPEKEKRLQAVKMHYAFVEQTAFPETRKMLTQLAARRAAAFEYLEEGGSQATFDKARHLDGGRVHNVVDAIAEEAKHKSTTTRMIMVDGRWRMVG